MRGAAFTAVLDGAALAWRVNVGGVWVGPFTSLALAFGCPRAAKLGEAA
ncbi:hypothetical protein [Anaeromyxobacter soli]|nr:hypothetical protein [Anaeromyxobacter sp. SG29]